MTISRFDREAWFKLPLKLRQQYWRETDYGRKEIDMSKQIGMFELHEKMTAHLFPAYSNTDERFLALALCGECGELANLIKKRWRDGVDKSEEIRDEIADIRVYLELIAKCFNVEGEKLDERVKAKLQKVAAKHGVK